MRASIGRFRPALTRVMAAATLTAAMGVIVATPTASHAAASCGAGPTVKNWQGKSFKTRTCPTWTATNVWSTSGEEWNSKTIYTGYLYAGNNWVVCQDYGDNHVLSGYRNNIWLYTQGDQIKSLPERNAWGWIPATVMSYGGDYQPIPGVPWCTGTHAGYSTYPGYRP